jgi:hypothetical protein
MSFRVSDIASSAALSGSTLTLGTNPAASGIIRLPNDQWIVWRNAANSADVNGIKVNASDYLQLGVRLIRDDIGSGAFGDTSSFIGLKRRMVNLTGAQNTPVSIIVQGYGTATTSDQHQGIGIAMNDEVGAVVNKTVTNCVDNGAGLIRVTATAHGFSTGDKIAVYGVTGTTEANGAWTITRVDANTFDLQASAFVNAYVAGGTATNRPLWYGIGVRVTPILDRGGLTGTAANGDDVNCYVAFNAGTGKGTDCFYIGRNAANFPASSEWIVGLNVGGNCDYGIRLTATYANSGLDFTAGTMTLGDAIKLGEGHNIALGTATGTKIGTATSQKLGFYNATPIAQRSGAAQAAVVTTGSTQTVPFGYATAAQADGIVTLVNELRAWAVAQGFIKGSA